MNFQSRAPTLYALLSSLAGALLLASCANPPIEPRDVSDAHIGGPRPATSSPVPAAASIPAPVTRAAILPPPSATQPLETYTVVVNGVPVRELLFALARDAAINVDIHPDIAGDVTLNAIDQTLPQILERLTAQLSLRYRFENDLLTIVPDTPFLRTYKVDYVNLSRATESTVTVSTQIASTAGSADGGGGGGGGNNSETTLNSSQRHDIWQTLQTTIASMVADPGSPVASDASADVIANAETGLITVRATASQHRQIQSYVDQVLSELRRQVLIEATVVEVTLSDRYQAGIDWAKIPLSAGGLAVAQRVIGGGGEIVSGAATSVANAVVGVVAPNFVAQYANRRDAQGNPAGDLTITASLLKEFGDVRVISSPKIMALNNQTALLKVVDNRVYFEVDVQTDTSPQGQITRTFETTVQTVPVGFVMSVTPQVDAADQVTLNVRPTISRILGFVNDPNPDLANAGVQNRVPELRVRELESILQVGSGNIAVLGGLMQDQTAKSTDGIPLLSDIPQVGEFFKFRDHNFSKTELVVFIRPSVVRTASVETGDLRAFEASLPRNLGPQQPIASPPPEVSAQ